MDYGDGPAAQSHGKNDKQLSLELNGLKQWSRTGTITVGTRNMRGNLYFNSIVYIISIFLVICFGLVIVTVEA